MVTFEELNYWKDKIHKNNVDVGWWNGVPEEGPELEEILIEKSMLIITEIAEATEGLRKDLMDDHLTHRKMEEVELADALIRTLDLAGFLKVDLDLGEESFTRLQDVWSKCVGEHAKVRPSSCHFDLVTLVLDLAESDWEDGDFSVLIYGFISYAESRGYDIMKAMEEKVEYNTKRADHKLENRGKKGGKSF